MKRAFASLLGVPLLAVVAAAAAQQQPHPAPASAGQSAGPSQSQPQQAPARPVLKLRLNEIDDSQRRAIVGSPPADTPRDSGSGGLPGLGGKPKRLWGEQNPEDIVPKTDPNSPY